MGKKWKRIGAMGVRVLAGIPTIYFFLQGLFTVCCIQRVSEKMFFVENHAGKQLLAIIVFAGIAGILRLPRIKEAIRKYGRYVCLGLLLLMTAFLTFWILNTQFWYSSDTEQIYMCVARYLEGDMSSFYPGGYMYMWPHQNGLFLFVLFLEKHFAMGTTFAIFYGCNIFFYLVTILSIWYFVKTCFPEKNIYYMQVILLICYLPYAFFCTFMYGNIIGFGFATLAMALECCYLKKEKNWALLLAAVSLVLAISFKQNELIVWIGMLIVLVGDLICRSGQRLRRLAMIVLFVGIVFLGMQLPGLLVENLTGTTQGPGNSRLAHVAMGLQQGDGQRPGWYNGYNNEVFEENGYDRTATEEACKATIAETLKNYRENPLEGWSFFHHKLATEWSNPTFECFNIQNARSTSLELSSLVKSVINNGGKLNILLTFIFDRMQGVLWFGILLYLFSAKDADLLELLPAILFIGGFLFFAFWEAKCQYVLPFFFLLIPYAYAGYDRLIGKIRLRAGWNSIYTGIVCVAVLALLIGCSQNVWICNSFKLNASTEEYYEYIHEYNTNFVNLRF